MTNTEYIFTENSAEIHLCISSQILTQNTGKSMCTLLLVPQNVYHILVEEITNNIQLQHFKYF